MLAVHLTPFPSKAARDVASQTASAVPLFMVHYAALVNARNEAIAQFGRLYGRWPGPNERLRFSVDMQWQHVIVKMGDTCSP